MSDLITLEEYEKAIDTINKYKHQIYLHYKDVSSVKVLKHSDFLEDLDMSLRLYNNLCYYFNKNSLRTITISDLEKVSITDFSMFRNVGKRSIEELKDICYNNAIKLKP